MTDSSSTPTQAPADDTPEQVKVRAAKRARQGKKGGVLRGLGSALSIFLRLYVLRRGFLCGGEGFLFCYIVAQESFFRYAALKYDAAHLTECVRR